MGSVKTRSFAKNANDVLRCVGNPSDERQGAGAISYQVQEICTYDAATQFTGAPDVASADEVALLRLRMAPRASVKSGGLLSKGATTVQVIPHYVA